MCRQDTPQSQTHNHRGSRLPRSHEKQLPYNSGHIVKIIFTGSQTHNHRGSRLPRSHEKQLPYNSGHIVKIIFTGNKNDIFPVLFLTSNFRTMLGLPTERVWSLKAPLHGTIRPHGAYRLPCTWANRSVWHVARFRLIGLKGFTARSIFEPILLHELCDYPIRAQPTPKTTARRVGCNNAPKCTHPASKYFLFCQHGILL